VDGAAVAAAAAAAVAAVESDPSNEVEEAGDEFAAYCRRGRGRRRVEMEDRHVAKLALGGDPDVVCLLYTAFSSLSSGYLRNITRSL
jgi:protein phosphatase 1L